MYGASNDDDIVDKDTGVVTMAFGNRPQCGREGWKPDLVTCHVQVGRTCEAPWGQIALASPGY